MESHEMSQNATKWRCLILWNAINCYKLECNVDAIFTKFYRKQGQKPFPKQQYSNWSKLKEFADNKSKFEKNARNLSKQGENTVGKGEIARYEQFLLFP